MASVLVLEKDFFPVSSADSKEIAAAAVTEGSAGQKTMTGTDGSIQSMETSQECGHLIVCL